ncbi:MAG: hypothetical protein ACRDJG_07930 [Actinomycetota bacterium]
MSDRISVDPGRLVDLALAFSRVHRRVDEALTAFAAGARDAGEATGRSELMAGYEQAYRGTVQALGQLCESLETISRRLWDQAVLYVATERSGLGDL